MRILDAVGGGEPDLRQQRRHARVELALRRVRGAWLRDRLGDDVGARASAD